MSSNIPITVLSTALACGLVLDSVAQRAPSVPTSPPPPNAATPEMVVLPRSVPDPLEPLNRAIWAFNKGVTIGVVQPTARVYRFIVRKPFRTGINNFTRNITYPGRLINNLLQAKWAGARHETDRFFCNT